MVQFHAGATGRRQPVRRPARRSSAPVVSLYNNDPNDFGDFFDTLGHRLLAQAGGGSGAPSVVSLSLDAGTYYVAVSGAGNQYFNPFLADSGYPGSPCNYDLRLTATDLPDAPGDGPVVLSADPGAGAQLANSPLVLRLDLSGALDPNTVVPDQTVQLTFNPTGQFGDGNDQAVALSGVNLSTAGDELQLTPVDALQPGFYRIFLAGDASGGPVLADLNGNPLGANAANPLGQDFSMTFQVKGVEGGAAADDTPATAHNLGDVTKAGLVQATGAIGDDPAYDPNSSDPYLSNPASDVDLYHFTVSGPGRYALTSEVFAGRIGSPLDPALTLFQADPVTGQLEFVAVNQGSLNSEVGTDGSIPLFLDPVLFAGLTAGNYYLAVSSEGNAPDPALGLTPGTDGVFDPNVSHSGSNGFSTGDYVLNLAVTPEPKPPQVVNVSLTQGAVLDAPPTTFTVQFSEPVNLPQLAYQTFQQSQATQLDAVYILGSDGVKIYPRMTSYDTATNEATFLMLAAVPNGPAELHLSGAGALGVADLAGNPLVGSSGPGSDYVVNFTVNGPAHGSDGNPLLGFDQEPNDTAASAQNLGVLFPQELQTGVVIQRVAGSATADTADFYEFQVLQQRQYLLTLNGSGLPKNALPTLTDAAGNPVNGIPQGKGGGVQYSLNPGTYIVSVGGWTAAQAAAVQYKLGIVLLSSFDNPPPLTTGPAPAIRLQIADDTNPNPPPGGGAPPGTPPSSPGKTPGGVATPVAPPSSSGDTQGGVAAPIAQPTDPDAPPAAPAAVSVIPTPALILLTLPGLADFSGAPGGGSVGSSGASDNILLTRVADAVGVRADLNAAVAADLLPDGGGEPDSTPAPDRVVGAAPASPPPTQASRDPGTVASTDPSGNPAVTPAPPIESGPSKLPMDALFEMNLLPSRFLALRDAAWGDAAVAGLLQHATLARIPDLPGVQGALPGAWMDGLAAVSAFAAVGLTGWCVVSPRLRRKPKNQDLNLLSE